MYGNEKYQIEIFDSITKKLTQVNKNLFRNMTLAQLSNGTQITLIESFVSVVSSKILISFFLEVGTLLSEYGMSGFLMNMFVNSTGPQFHPKVLT